MSFQNKYNRYSRYNSLCEGIRHRKYGVGCKMKPTKLLFFCIIFIFITLIEKTGYTW